MPVLISLGNGYMKMIDDGRPPEDPSGYRFLDVKSAPIEVKQEIMGEIEGLRGSIMHAGESGPAPTQGKPNRPDKGMMAPATMPKPQPQPQSLPPDLMGAMQGSGAPPGMMGPPEGMEPGPMKAPPPDMPMDMPMGPGPGYQRRGY